MPDRLAALDTEVLLAIEAGTSDCVGAHSALRSAGFLFRATPTVIQELERNKHNHRKEYAASLAANLLDQGTLLELGVVSAPMNDTEQDVTEIHARTLMEKDVLAGSKYSNEGDISALIEAAYADCVLFITSNDDLLERRQPLTLALMEVCGMGALLIAHPQEIIDVFSEPEEPSSASPPP